MPAGLWVMEAAWAEWFVAMALIGIIQSLQDDHAYTFATTIPTRIVGGCLTGHR